LADLTAVGFELSEPIQEDYGWGFWVSRGPDQFWIALSFCGDGPTEEPAEWVVLSDMIPVSTCPGGCSTSRTPRR
jgi:hypothetical protein